MGEELGDKAGELFYRVRVVDSFVRGQAPLRGSGGCLRRNTKGFQIVRASCFEPNSELASLHATERLAIDDGPGDGFVDIEISGIDAVDPSKMFIFIEALKPGREAVGCVIGELKRVI